MKSCRVCGSKNISRFWSGRISPLVYCSFKCSTVGNRYINFTLSLILGWSLIYLTTLATGIPSDRLGEKMGLYIVLGYLEVWILLITIYGFISNR